MAIVIEEKNRIFTLQTKHSTYQMKADAQGTLLHTYYGEKTEAEDLSYRICYADRGFSGNPYMVGKTDRTYSLDVLPQEYSTFGAGDFRTTALRVRYVDGSQATTLRYQGCRRLPGKYAIPGLPAVYASCEEAETLVIALADPETNLAVDLYYGVLAEADVITRCARIRNGGRQAVVLEKAASVNLDWQYGDYDWLTFYGKHTMERMVQRLAIGHGTSAIGSVRGTSSHQYNPFAIVCEKGTEELHGGCYGISFVYSGEFLFETEHDQFDQTRLVCGIHPDNFAWTLQPGEEFDTPEAVLVYRPDGFSALSRAMHEVVREHICRGKWKHRRRPVLINNWEATYFDFTGEKLVEIAQEASKLGVELFVMDDGWFGKRDTDFSGLGDWQPNEKKLKCTLKELGEKICETGMQFGIWFEPEGLSEDSDLFRAHPDWAVRVPGKLPALSRNQLVLDFSRREVQDYILGELKRVIGSAPVSYVKWDFNRSICDKYSMALSAQENGSDPAGQPLRAQDNGSNLAGQPLRVQKDWSGRMNQLPPVNRQGEFAHRYVLGLYHVLDELLQAFPHLLIEGCSGGGGRFDAGMLYYTPQIWCSDNTDAISRLQIQYGTSFGYPVSAVGAHVSAIPNHQTWRSTPLRTRGCVAMSGTFGYELDISKMTEEEKAEVKRQIAFFKKHYDLIQYGIYYRLTDPRISDWAVWEQAARDGSEALVNAVCSCAQSNAAPVLVKVQGLKEEGRYVLEIAGAAAVADGEDIITPTAAGTDGEDIITATIPGTDEKNMAEPAADAADMVCRGEDTDIEGARSDLGFLKKQYGGIYNGKPISGASLMHAGLPLPPACEEYQAWQILVREI